MGFLSAINFPAGVDDDEPEDNHNGEEGEEGEETEEKAPKKMGKVQKFVSKIWRTNLTTQTPGEEDQELVVISSFRELGIYFGFVVILCVMTFGEFSINMPIFFIYHLIDFLLPELQLY